MNVYEIVTEQIVKLLETGTVPWRRPWIVSNDAPRNLVSKKPYRGVNTFLLGASRYAAPYWVSFKQARELGGSVRKGEESTIVVFWKVDSSVASGDADAIEANARTRFMLRYYRVFNVAQCDLPEKVLAKIPQPETRDNPPIASAEKIILEMPRRPEMVTGNQACYFPRHDRVMLPAIGAHYSAEEYYATAFHELTHSTGHASRLNREGVTGTVKFGSGDYSREELVAEMGASFLCGEAGILPATIENSAAYLKAWIDRLKGDSRLVVLAAAQAQKAADYILNRNFAK